MRLILDSNSLQSDSLLRYLSQSRSNFGVINDYLSMEAYKGNTLVSIDKSMRIISEFPTQVIVLKTTGAISRLSGKRAGLQRRMIDQAQSNDFPQFCRDLKSGLSGDMGIRERILANGRVADTHMTRILADAPIMAPAIKELKEYFSKDELNIIRLDQEYPTSLIEKSLQFITNLFLMTIRSAQSPPRARTRGEIVNLFLFRLAVCNFVWATDWLRKGGADGVRPDRMRNDIVDQLFATYGTYFDGVLSNDTKMVDLHRRTRIILNRIGAAR